VVTFVVFFRESPSIRKKVIFEASNKVRLKKTLKISFLFAVKCFSMNSVRLMRISQLHTSPFEEFMVFFS